MQMYGWIDLIKCKFSHHINHNWKVFINVMKNCNSLNKHIVMLIICVTWNQRVWGLILMVLVMFRKPIARCLSENYFLIVISKTNKTYIFFHTDHLHSLRSRGPGFNSYSVLVMSRSLGQALNPHHPFPPSRNGDQVEQTAVLCKWLQQQKMHCFLSRDETAKVSSNTWVNWCKAHWTYWDIWTVNNCLTYPYLVEFICWRLWWFFLRWVNNIHWCISRD